MVPSFCGVLQRKAMRQQASLVLICLGIGGVLSLLVWRSYEFVRYLSLAIHYPFGLDYGEGIVWLQATLIPSKLMYGDIDRYPYIVFHYPPLYHLVVKLLHALSGRPYLPAGRLVSATSTLFTAAFVGALSFRLARAASLSVTAASFGAVIAALLPSTFRPEIIWAPVFRVDLLAGALTFAGLLVAERSIRSPRFVFVAAVLFVAAVYTKQTEIAAPLSAMLALVMVHRRVVIVAVVLGLAVALAGLVTLELKTSGGFLRHIIVYNANPVHFRNVIAIFKAQEDQGVYLCLAVLGVYLVWRSRISDSQARGVGREQLVLPAMLSGYFALTTAMLAITAKDGSYVNYLLDWMNAGTIFIGFTVSYGLFRAFDPLVCDYPFMLLLLGVLGSQIIALPAADRRELHNAKRLQELERLAKFVRQAKRPVLSDDIVLLMIAGRQVAIEPAIFRELALSGIWDEQREIDMVRSEFFAAVIETPGLFRHDYTPAVLHSILSCYPSTVSLGGLVIHFPSGESHPELR